MCHYPKKGWTFGYFEMGDIRDNYISGILIGQLVIHSRFLSVANVCHGRLEKRLLLAVYANFPANQSSFLAKVPFPAIFTSLGCSIPWIFQVKFAGWMPLPAPRRVRFAPFVWWNWPRRMRRPGRADQLNQDSREETCVRYEKSKSWGLCWNLVELNMLQEVGTSWNFQGNLFSMIIMQLLTLPEWFFRMPIWRVIMMQLILVRMVCARARFLWILELNSFISMFQGNACLNLFGRHNVGPPNWVSWFLLVIAITIEFQVDRYIYSILCRVDPMYGFNESQMEMSGAGHLPYALWPFASQELRHSLPEPSDISHAATRLQGLQGLQGLQVAGCLAIRLSWLSISSEKKLG